MSKATHKGYELEVDVPSDTLTIRLAGFPNEVNIPRSTLMKLFEDEAVEADLGPTLQEFFDAGYNPANYPPFGYNAKPFTPEQMDELLEKHTQRMVSTTPISFEEE